jgi:flagellar biosynthesis protein FliR
MTVLGEITSGALPGLPLQGLYDPVLQFMLLSLRIGSFLVSAPFFGSRSVVVTIRIVATCAMAFSLIDRTPTPEILNLSNLEIISVALQEIVIGLCAGMVMSIMFSSVALAGEKIASTSGLSFATQIDPNAGGTTPVVSQIFTLFLTTVFLSVNGHLISLAIVLKSYEAFPIGTSFDSFVLFEGGVNAAREMFSSAATIMLPFAAIMTLINISIGIITRSAPTLNLFSFGFPITLISIFIILFVSVPHLAVAFSDHCEQMLQALKILLQGGRDG